MVSQKPMIPRVIIRGGINAIGVIGLDSFTHPSQDYAITLFEDNS
jgi:hypothetical protein